MIWNWQRKNWPQFEYNEKQFEEYERRFFENAGIIQGSILHLNLSEQESLKIDLIADEAVKTSEIEGEILNRESIQSSIRRHFGLPSDSRKVSPQENGISEMMVDIQQNGHFPLTESILFRWHQLLMTGRRDLKDIGAYRTHVDPMQVVSGPIGRPVIHFEAPPSALISDEMSRFIEWFNDSETRLPVLVRSAIAHLYFESIHPFEDGNGRIGRALSEKALTQGLGKPVFIALSHVIQENKKEYYKALEVNNKDLEINDWIDYFCNTILLAQQFTQQVVGFMITKRKFYQQFSGKLNDRQLKVIQRIFEEGAKGFAGGLSSRNYQTIAGTPSATATRDLADLVEKGAFVKIGQLKSTRYFINLEAL